MFLELTVAAATIVLALGTCVLFDKVFRIPQKRQRREKLVSQLPEFSTREFEDQCRQAGLTDIELAKELRELVAERFDLAKEKVSLDFPLGGIFELSWDSEFGLSIDLSNRYHVEIPWDFPEAKEDFAAVVKYMEKAVAEKATQAGEEPLPYERMHVELKWSSKSDKTIWTLTMELHEDRFVFKQSGRVKYDYPYAMIERLRLGEIHFQDGRVLRPHGEFYKEAWLDKLVKRLWNAGNRSACLSLRDEAKRLSGNRNVLLGILFFGTLGLCWQAFYATGIVGVTIAVTFGNGGTIQPLRDGLLIIITYRMKSTQHGLAGI